MPQSYQPCLYGHTPIAPTLGEPSWLRLIMLAFAALHRQQWSAPWDAPRHRN